MDSLFRRDLQASPFDPVGKEKAAALFKRCPGQK